MIPITITERDALVTKYDVWYGEGGITHTYTHHPKYYLCESGKNKKALKEYYKEIGLNPADVDKRCAGK